MKNILKFYLILTILATMLFLPRTASAAATIVTYPGPPGIPASDLYSVRVCDGTTWYDSFTYKDSCISDYGDIYGDPYYDTNSITIFDISGTGNVSVEITRLAGPVTSIEVRPKSANIQTGIEGGKGYYILTSPVKCFVVINGDYRNPVSVLAGSPITAPDPDDPNVLYYDPGVYTGSGTDNVLEVPEGKDLYLAGGAYLKARVHSTGAATKIYGRGIISGEGVPTYGQEGIPEDKVQLVTKRGNNSIIQGVTLMHEYTPFSLRVYGDNNIIRDVRISGLNVYALGGNDGACLVGKYGIIDNCFEVCADDTGYIGGDYCITTNTFFTTARAGGIQFAGACNDAEGEQLRNCDLFIVSAENQQYYPYPLFCTQVTGEKHKQVLVDNCYIEGKDIQRWFYFYVKNGGAYDYDPSLKGNVTQYVFRNCTVVGNFTYQPVFEGYDSTHSVNNITFDNLKVNGSYIHNATEGNFYIDSNCYNINFIVPSSAPGSFGLTWPQNGATSVLDTTTFTWSPSNNAVSYELIVSENSDLSSPVFDMPTITNASYQTQMDLGINKTYYWKVIASNGLGSVVSGVNSFTTDSTAVKTGFVTDTYPLPGAYVGDPVGFRYDGPNYVGYQFTPSSDITVNALGRPFVFHSMNVNHEIAIWRVSDQTKIASVVLTPKSRQDTMNYRYEMLQSPVTLSAGTAYRVVSAEYRGLTTGFLNNGYYDTDPWRDYGVISHTSIAAVDGSCFGYYDNPIGLFPNVLDNSRANYGYVGIQLYTGSPNLALNKTATASSEHSSVETASNAVDGLANDGVNCWTATAGETGWLQVDLGAVYNVSRYVVKHADPFQHWQTQSLNTRDFKLQTSTDGVNWTDRDTVTGNTADVTDHNISPTSCRYVRIYITNPQTETNWRNCRIYELEVY